MTAVAIFVKTPGLSPVKTRLASGIGVARAGEFHRLAAAAVAAVAQAAAPDLEPYWAVAERAGLEHPLWAGLPTLWQGEGGLGTRLHHVYSGLLARHGAVLLIGADAPQVTPALLRTAADAVRRGGTPYAIGPASDGGFWLFGGRAPVPENVWRAVAYSRDDTRAQLAAGLRPLGEIAAVTMLADADRPADLPGLLGALSALADKLPEQAALACWLRTLAETSGRIEHVEERL